VRIDAVLLVAAALLFGGCGALFPLPVALVAIAVTALVGPRIGLVALLCVLAGAGLGAYRAGQALGAFEAERIWARDALGPPSRCVARARVAHSPVSVGGATSFIADLRAVDCEGRRPFGSRPVRARLYGGPSDVGRGDELEVVAQLAPLRLFRNVGIGDGLPQAARRGVLVSGACASAVLTSRGRGLGALIDRARTHARLRIEATFVPAAAPMARALVLGENDLDPEDDEAFRQSGLAHILAVSGTHLVFAVVALVHALRSLLVRIERLAARYDVGRAAAGCGALLALAYADFAGGSGSAWRAAWMLTAAFAVTACGRRPNTARVFAVSLFVGAVVDPLASFDVSFLLSAAATAGLIAVGQPLARRCQAIARRPLRYVALSTAATLSSMLPCAPLLALMAPELTLAGVVANLVAAPIGEVVALPLCLAHSLLGALPPLERGAALVASGALLAVKTVAHAAADARFFAFAVPAPGAWHLALIAVASLGWLLATGEPRACIRRGLLVAWFGALCLGLATIERASARAGGPSGQLRVTAVDVGQGDSTLIDLPDGSLMLIDGGGFVGSPVDPGRAVLLPLLRQRRRERIDIAVLTHPHPDHFTGLASALEHVEVGELWDSGQGESEGAGPLYAKLLAGLRKRGVPVLRPPQLCGQSRHYGGAVMQLLGPCPRFVPGRDANDNSLVVRLEFGTRAVLLTGDAEQAQERELIGERGANLSADLLKVGHHGSRTSSSEPFIAAVRPALATISSGVRNRFGHPHLVTLQRLSAAKVLALRLDRAGSVVWRSDGNSVEVSVFSLPR
jgi:competence protein ComEC